jgi:hypothetical protein
MTTNRKEKSKKNRCPQKGKKGILLSIKDVIYFFFFSFFLLRLHQSFFTSYANIHAFSPIILRHRTTWGILFSFNFRYEPYPNAGYGTHSGDHTCHAQYDNFITVGLTWTIEGAVQFQCSTS